jgi:hypothetical protein
VDGKVAGQEKTSMESPYFRYGKNLGPHLALPIFLLKNKYDIIVNDLGHAVPWVLSTFMSKHNIVFSAIFTPGLFQDR